MDMAQFFTDMISNVAFPIACCYFMGKYITNKDSTNQKRYDELNKNYIELSQLAITAIQNNTNAMNDLKEKIEEDRKNDN